MFTCMASTGTDQDWRLEAELQVADASTTLERLLGRFRDPKVVDEVEAAVAPDVVITHDGSLLFAYATSQPALAAARQAIEAALEQDGIRAHLRVSHWDEQLDRWRQTDPPPDAQAQQAERVAERDAMAIETRTLVATVGKMIRAGFDQSLRVWAEQLGLECKIVEHPHLLSTQVAFTVTGPRHRIEEFRQGLRAEERATIRTEGELSISPL
jgi:hypothetical protein